ncbi:MAG: sugar phosphate isomerase/epimerase [Clostridiales bacterium]|jgi:sugar phosphate isomerase/epimerase|nr:sugar phosphate isomerase/epimerase [Clostridiales bacterium]
MNIGIGTYSFGGIASYLGLGPTLPEKFRKARELGFDSVELLPVDLAESAEDIKKWLAETGLTVTSVHAEPSEEIVKKLSEIGGKAVIWAGTPFNSRKEAVEVARQLDEMARMAAPYGVKVGYHNHSQEFYVDEGKALLEHLVENGSDFYLQLDCGWAMNGGMYPPYFIRKYKNRILSIHVKENDKVNGPGGKPASRYDEKPAHQAAFAKAKTLPLEERQKMLEQFNANMKANASRMSNQCKLGAKESNLDWKEIKKALDEQDFDAFWIVEREGFYDEHDKCLREDLAWLKDNIGSSTLFRTVC